MHESVAVLLQIHSSVCMPAKKYQNRTWFDKVSEKNKRTVTFYAPQCSRSDTSHSQVACAGRFVTRRTVGLAVHVHVKVKVKEADLYSAFIEVPYTQGAQVRITVTCKLHRTCLYLVSIHQMAHPRLRLRTSNCSLLLIYLPRKDERLSWPRWLVT